MKRLAWFVMVAVVGLMLTGGSTGFGAHPKKAPARHGGGKPAHSARSTRPNPNRIQPTREAPSQAMPKRSRAITKRRRTAKNRKKGP